MQTAIVIGSIIAGILFWILCWRQSLYYEGVNAAKEYPSFAGPTAPALSFLIAPMFMVIGYVSAHKIEMRLNVIEKVYISWWAKGRNS